MKFIKLKHYVECSFGSEPGFIIEMSDGKDYISHGCVWVENTQENLSLLVDEFNCKLELDELLAAPSISLNDLPNARSMFENSPITQFHYDLPNTFDTSFMFESANILSFRGTIPIIISSKCMFFSSMLRILDTPDDFKLASCAILHTPLSARIGRARR